VKQTSQSRVSQIISLRSVLILNSHLRLGSPSDFFPSGISTNNLCATCPEKLTGDKVRCATPVTYRTDSFITLWFKVLDVTLSCFCINLLRVNSWENKTRYNAGNIKLCCPGIIRVLSQKIWKYSKYINEQINALHYLWYILFTIFSPTCFGLHSGHFQGDVIITRIQTTKIW